MDAVANAPTIVDALRRADELAFEAGREPGVRSLRHLATALAGADDVRAIAAVHALGAMADEEAGRMLGALLSDPRAYIREHAAWALGQGLPRHETVARLIDMVAAGGFSGMLAQRTLEGWSVRSGELLAVALEAAVTASAQESSAARARLVETLGLVRAPIATRPLIAWARDAREEDAVREAAIAALGQRGGQPGVEAALTELTADAGRLGDVARLAQEDLAPVRSEATGVHTIAQLFLHADMDAQLATAGAGDNGGIATLLVRLGDALAAQDADTRVITLGRGSVTQAATDLRAVAEQGAGHRFGRVPMTLQGGSAQTLPEGSAQTVPASTQPVPSAAAWPLRVSARRGIRRMLRAAGRVDVLHLRMADVGSLAAADVARELGIPTVFTLAPDPHSVITSLEESGQLTREGFGEADLREHYWFRARLVQSLAGGAEHTVLFPRPALADDMRRLVGVDIAAHAERHTVVAEGVDLAVVDGAVAAVGAHLDGADDAPEGFAELVDMLAALPVERRGLPLLVSVGRMHRVKGMASLVEAWAGSALADRANLLIVGGDLEHPSVDEREQLERIDALVPDRAARGLLLPGHRPNGVTAVWLAAARLGVPGLAAPGAYVCASIKEEFGIALLEAMAAGLVVVAPDAGGPATYVEHGDTGFLVPTWDRERFVAAIGEALDRGASEEAPAVARRARDMVEARFTIQAMASTLSELYRRVALQDADLRALAVLS